MNRLANAEQFIKKANQLHNDKYDYSNVEYVNSRTKVTIICPEHGEFDQLPSSHLQGNGCPKCARVWTDAHKRNLQKSSRKSRGMTTDEWIARAQSIHGDKYDYSKTEYVNQRTNVKIICPIHGEFEQKADSHIRGHGCKKCGDTSENHKGAHTWSDGQREKIINTCLEKYGAKRYLDSEEGRKKLLEVKSTSEFRDKMSTIISSEDVQNRTKETCISKYGFSSAMKLERTVDKVYATKKKNHTWSSSKPEEKMYVLLCNKFGEDDVMRQYKDKVRYPYHSDFYIKSLDLFIELNASWLHGGHWFNECDENDLSIFHMWEDKVKSGKKFYTVAIDVWTVRDLKKYNTALTNQLNYLVFWKNDLSDFMDWLNADCLVLSNI